MKQKKEALNKKTLRSYSGPIVLGLNDALVEITGALAGFTFALRESNIIAVTGLVTGIAAALSMAASQYLSSEEGPRQKKQTPLKKAIYTGSAYIIAVFILVFPYLVMQNVFVALALTLFLALCMIAFYTSYISKERKTKHWKKFAEMALITLSIATISFLIGSLLRNLIL